MKVLVISPHMDDEVLGVGGVITRHVKAQDEVHVCFVANRAYQHAYDEKTINGEKECARRAREVLGYHDMTFLDFPDERLYAHVQEMIIALEERVRAFRPELVYVPHHGDNNQDHRAVFEAVRVALRPIATAFLSRVLSFEVPSSTEQSPPLPDQVFCPNSYVDISPYLDTKLRALAEYKTEVRDFPHPRSIEGVRVLAKYRGMTVGLQAAEAFVILRERLSTA